jgi:acyl-CoA thioesterase
VRRVDGDGADGRAAAASYLADVSPRWCINGRPHGGYLAAIIMRTLLEAVGDPQRAPRSLTIHFLRPPRPGEVLIEAVTERAGGSLSTLSGRIEQHGETVALALAAFSLARASLEVAELPMPDVAAPDPEREMSAVLIERIEQGLAPSFLRNLVIQPRHGDAPFTGSDAPLELSAWLGLAEPQRPLDAIALALYSDALFPTPFPRLTEPGGAPTIDLTVHFREGAARMAARDPAELCLAQFRSGLIHEGFFEEDGVIWAADGTVLAQSRQLALLIAPAAV